MTSKSAAAAVNLDRLALPSLTPMIAVSAGSRKQEGDMRTLFEQLIVLLIVGLVGGSLAAVVVKRERKGFGVILNLGLGLAGAVVGGLVFRLFGLFPDLDKISISFRDVVSATLGSVLVLVILWLWHWWTR